MSTIEELRAQLTEVLPKTGLVYSERGGLTEILCKPKIMPLKSEVLKKLEKIEQQTLETNNGEEKDQSEEETINVNKEVKEEEIYNSEKERDSGESKSRK